MSDAILVRTYAMLGDVLLGLLIAKILVAIFPKTIERLNRHLSAQRQDAERQLQVALTRSSDMSVENDTLPSMETCTSAAVDDAIIRESLKLSAGLIRYRHSQELFEEEEVCLHLQELYRLKIQILQKEQESDRVRNAIGYLRTSRAESSIATHLPEYVCWAFRYDFVFAYCCGAFLWAQQSSLWLQDPVKDYGETGYQVLHSCTAKVVPRRR